MAIFGLNKFTSPFSGRQVGTGGLLGRIQATQPRPQMPTGGGRTPQPTSGGAPTSGVNRPIPQPQSRPNPSGGTRPLPNQQGNNLGQILQGVAPTGGVTRPIPQPRPVMGGGIPTSGLARPIPPTINTRGKRI